MGKFKNPELKPLVYPTSDSSAQAQTEQDANDRINLTVSTTYNSDILSALSSAIAACKSYETGADSPLKADIDRAYIVGAFCLAAVTAVDEALSSDSSTRVQTLFSDGRLGSNPCVMAFVALAMGSTVPKTSVSFKHISESVGKGQSPSQPEEKLNKDQMEYGTGENAKADKGADEAVGAAESKEEKVHG